MRRGYLWVAVTQGMSVFVIRASRGAKVLRELGGEAYGRVLTSDRAKAYNPPPLRQRQLGERSYGGICKRGLTAAERGRKGAPGCWWPAGDSLRGGPGGGLGSGSARRCDGRGVASDPRCERPGRRGRARGPEDYGSGSGAAGAGARGVNVRAGERSEPTHKAAERTLRHAGQWRQSSSGTECAAGRHFVDNILPVWAPCHQQERPGLAYLTPCCPALSARTAPPARLPQPRS
jgi:hypothetical protein